MGLAGVRTPDNMAMFDAKRPQVVVYFDVDFERNLKGQRKCFCFQKCPIILLTQAATTGETGIYTHVYRNTIVTWCVGGCYPLTRVIKVAKDYVGEVSFAVSSKTVLYGEMEEFGLDSEQEVSVGLFDSQGRKYAMTDKFR